MFCHVCVSCFLYKLKRNYIFLSLQSDTWLTIAFSSYHSLLSVKTFAVYRLWSLVIALALFII